MRYTLFVIFTLIFSHLHSVNVLGIDSGNKSIIMYDNNLKTESALLIIGGIHGDEGETVQVVDYIREQLDTSISVYYIPSLNPTLYSIREKSKEGVIEIRGRRGYLSEHLDKEGYVIQGSPLTKFNKELFYRIFYGTEKAYINGIKHYVDPNRDYIEKRLPSTRILIQLIDSLATSHKRVIILSFHGYMSEGRVYPEYSLINGVVKVDIEAWELATAFENGSQYKKERLYSPALPILDRFDGELIRYTGTIDNVIAMDIEIDSNRHTDNKKRSLNGIEMLINYLLTRD